MNNYYGVSFWIKFIFVNILDYFNTFETSNLTWQAFDPCHPKEKKTAQTPTFPFILFLFIIRGILS
jgi:hypothetical protein